jgi:hypothetical protein
MSSRSLTLRRLGVGAVALATAAAGLPLLLSSAASADPASRLVITQDNTRATAAAGTCTAFTVTASDPFGNAADAATITVTIAESPQSENHDVDFCLIDGGTPFAAAPRYTNEETSIPVQGGSAQQYDAGPSITQVPGDSPAPPPGYAAASTDNPDNADNAAGGIVNDEDNNENPSGEDQASFRSVNGQVRFGVVGLLTNAAATIDAYVDNGTPFTRDNSGDAAFEDNVVAQQRRVSFTQGGLPGTAAVNDAVSRVELKPDESIAAKPAAGSSASHNFTLQAFNASGDVLGGVNQGRLVATSGPNAPTSTSTSGTFSSSCAATGNEGEPALCSYTAQEAGTDTVTGFVNQTTGSPTPNLDSTEPRDTAQAVTTPPAVSASQARYVVLTPESASVSAGSSRAFTATVTDVNGAPATGVALTFVENGPGTLQGGTAGSGASTSRVLSTDGVGRATVTLLTSSGDTGSNTLAVAINNPTGTQCQAAASGTTPAGTCSDTSAITVTAASPSPTASPSATPTATVSPSPSTPTTQSGTRYRGLSSPVRVLDTRDNRGARRTGEIVLDLSSRITDPNATTAVLNVTVTNATARGFLVAYPAGTAKPGTSNVNFEQSQTQANEVVVRMSADKRVSLFVDSAAAHVIADLVGSFTSTASNETGRVITNAPDRAFDSRNTSTPTRSGEVIVNLSDQLPAGATGAVLNVTVTRTSARGFVTVYPTGTTRPGTSNVNFERGQTQANEVITQVGTGANAGRVSFFIDSASASLIVDVVGAVAGDTGQTFTALSSPQRAFDSRDNRGARRTGAFDVTMPSSVPANATGVILNVTATNGTRPGFVTVYPAGTANPGTSNVNFPTNRTQANEVTSGLGTDNRVTLFAGGANAPAAHVIVDVVGYLTS